MQKEGVKVKSAQKKANWRRIDGMPTTLYAVHGCTEGDFDAACDDPKSCVEGGMGDFAAPQLIGIASLPGLALEMGIHHVGVQLSELYDTDFDGEPWLPGQSPLDKAKWVTSDDKPYDDSCPLRQDFYEAGAGWADELVGKPRGRPYYEVYLVEPDPGVRTSAYNEPGTLACVVVQELSLDKQEVDE